MSGECDRCGFHCLECVCDGRDRERAIRIAYCPYGIHEALHTAHVLMDTYALHVCEHPAVEERQDIANLAEVAMEAMMEVYQALGRVSDAEGTEAQRAETAKTGSVHDGPVPKGCARNQ